MHGLHQIVILIIDVRIKKTSVAVCSSFIHHFYPVEYLAFEALRKQPFCLSRTPCGDTWNIVEYCE